MAAAEASFNTSTVSISWTSKLDKSPVGIPSTTYKGSEELVMELIPLMRTMGCVPGVPLATTLTPATLPCKACVKLAAGTSLRVLSYTHLRAHETGRNLVCRLLLEKKNN